MALPGPYEFYVNGKLSHKGVNAFTLLEKITVGKSFIWLIHEGSNHQLLIMDKYKYSTCILNYIVILFFLLVMHQLFILFTGYDFF
jgi:hypothetical protein